MIRTVILNIMEIYEIRPSGEGKQCVLSGQLGIVDSMQVESVTAAALHAQFCAQGNDAVLRTYAPDGTLRDERAIPPRQATCIHGTAISPMTYF